MKNSNFVFEKDNTKSNGSSQYTNIKQSEVYKKMAQDVARRRRTDKSIWTDKPVIPRRKSIWIEDEDDGLDDFYQEEKTSNFADELPEPIIKSDSTENVEQSKSIKTFEFKLENNEDGIKPIFVSEEDKLPKKKYRVIEENSFKKEIEIVINKNNKLEEENELPAGFINRFRKGNNNKTRGIKNKHTKKDYIMFATGLIALVGLIYLMVLLGTRGLEDEQVISSSATGNGEVISVVANSDSFI